MAIPPTEDKGSLGRIVKLEMKNFLKSPHARPFKGKGEANSNIALRLFLECIYIYHDEAPKDLDTPEFRQVVLETLPRRFTEQDDFLPLVPKVVRAYIGYLKEETQVKDPEGFEKVLDEMSKKFTKAVKKVKPKDRIDKEDATGQILKKGEKPGRNDPCPCGSGKKYKRCCYLKETG